MPVLESRLGYHLDTWLDRLDDEGFHIGVRERLLVLNFLARLSACGELSETQSLQEILQLAGPLVCTKPEQQRQYASLLEEFVAHPGRIAEHEGKAGEDRLTQQKPWSLRWWQSLLIIALIVVCVFVTWRLFRQGKGEIVPPSGPVQIENPQIPSTQKPAPTSKPIYVPVSSLPISDGPSEPGWVLPMRITLLGLGGLSLLALAWLAWARWRRQLYLQATSTDEEVTERFLKDPHPIAIEPAPALIRVASRQLRQRYTGERQVIDIRGTLRASMSAAGALVLRYRAMVHTPEYLILIDQRHPGDHHTEYCNSLVNALKDAGVAAHVHYFEGSPQTGCWDVRAGSRVFEHARATSFSELAARFTGHRLLVFADAQALVEESDGKLRAWSKNLRLFPQRAWLTPMPLASWGPLEPLFVDCLFLRSPRC